MSYSVFVDRTKSEASFDGGILILPLGPGSTVWKRSTLPLSATKNLTVSPHARDLLDVAICIYLADRYLPRSERELWCRSIELKISLRDPGAFKAIESKLRVCLNVLGADNFTFTVTQMQNTNLDSPPKFRKRVVEDESITEVALLSGGQDSVGGALGLLNDKNKNPLFIRINTQDGVSNPKLASRLRAAVKRKINIYSQPAVSIRGSAEERLSKESTQRLRSFYFLTIGSVIAQTYGIDSLYINENGIMAIHLPLDPSRYSSFSTRTAYPSFIGYFEDVIRTWLNFQSLKIKNNFVLKTKAEVIEEASNAGFTNAISKTISCAHSGTIKQTVSNLRVRKDLVVGKAQELHCGYCFPCVLRRISMYSAGLEKKDVKYAFNPFELTLHTEEEKYKTVQEATSVVLNLVQFVRFILKSSDTNILIKYGQIAECAALLELKTHQPLIKLHRKFALEVTSYIEKKASHLNYLFNDDTSEVTEEVIQSLVSREKLEALLLELGVPDWNEKFEDQILKSYGDLRIYIQTSIAAGRVTEADLEKSVKKLILKSLPKGFEKAEKQFNQIDGKEARASITSGCRTKCWPITRG